MRPVGVITRGKTAAYRLRRTDLLVVHAYPELLRPGRRGAFVDLGYGETPTTTLESARRFRRLDPGLVVIGIEIEPDRVELAQRYADARTRFRRGGFELPLVAGESARVIRAMNVLRQYPEEAVCDAHQRLLAQLEPDGLLIEGTCSPTGDRMVLNLLRPGASPVVAFSVPPARIPEHPSELQPRLPKNLIHRMVPGEPVHDLMAAWDRAWQTTAHHRTFGPLCHWAAAGRALMRDRPDVVHRPAWLRRGWLFWRPTR